MPSTVRGPGDIAVNEAEKVSAFLDLTFQWGEREGKQMNKLFLKNSQMVKRAMMTTKQSKETESPRGSLKLRG